MSIRTVAEYAGVVVGSLRHVFPVRSELVRFSAELMVQRATERLLAITPHDDPREHVLAIVKSLLPLEPNSRAEFEINLALFTERTAVPDLVEVRDDAHRRLANLSVRLVEMLTGDTGTPATNMQARRLHALIDGLAFHLIHQPPEEDCAWALAVIQDEIVKISDI